MSERNKKMHPHKFLLWVAIGSITMMFAGFTSAYIVKSNQAGWQPVPLPQIFYGSTLLIVISSLTIFIAEQQFKKREMAKYKLWITTTALLGIAFLIMQVTGFLQLWEQQYTFQDSVAGSFFYIIAGMHGLHLAGGIIALLLLFFRAFGTKTRYYSAVPIEIAGIYWHFVDLLWVYLFVFFMMVS